MSVLRPQLFGTDGIRGEFGRYPLDEPTMRRLGLELAGCLRQPNGRVPRVVIGGDPRDSTAVLCRWLASGLTAAGVEITYLGTVTTPCVACTTRRLEADAGIAVSASHNRHPDNGVKLIDGRGFKWDPEAEIALEERLAASDRVPAAPPPMLAIDREAITAYLQSLAATLPGERPLDGLRIVIDAAHGAASTYAGPLFEKLGARVTLTHAEPDGTNINAACGSTHPEVMAELVRGHGADLGFAFDGDADRVIAADELGQTRDGDAVLFLWARDLNRQGRLPGHRIVATSMSNLGLDVALRREGIEVVRCDVGDRVVVETMRREGIVLGGEQSGHVVHLNLSTTGDGLLTALQVARLRVEAKRPLSQMLQAFHTFPQLIENVRVRHKPDLETLPRVQQARQTVEKQLGDEGRLVLRYSGTEPLARIMIEGRDANEIRSLARELASVLAEELS